MCFPRFRHFAFLAFFLAMMVSLSRYLAAALRGLATGALPLAAHALVSGLRNADLPRLPCHFRFSLWPFDQLSRRGDVPLPRFHFTFTLRRRWRLRNAANSPSLNTFFASLFF